VPVASKDARWRSTVRAAKYTARRHPALTALAGMLLVGIATWVGLVRSDAGRETDFFRMIPQGEKDYRLVQIRDRQEEVAKGDLLGFTLRASGDVEVYALSLYGSADGELYVSAWKATDKHHLDRLTPEKRADPSEPFGFHLALTPEPMKQIVGTWLDQDPVNQREGLLVLVAHDASVEKKIEAWMARLQDAEKAGDVPWNRAVGLLTPPTLRGGSLHAPSKDEYFDPKLLGGMYRALDADEKKAVRRLGLPGVEEYAIECRVTGS